MSSDASLGRMATSDEPNHVLCRLLRSWRERLDPEQVTTTRASRRRKRTVSQEDVARLVGVSSVWYGRLERGERAGFSLDFLERTAQALRLNDAERAMLYLCAVGHEPRPRRGQPSPAVVTPMREIVDRQPWPAYVIDDAWQITYHNRHMGRWFPNLDADRGVNVIRWVVLDSDMRRRLCNWETDWVCPMLAQVRLAHARHPDHSRLADLVRGILDASATARRLWRDEPLVLAHFGRDKRRLYVPDRSDPIQVEVVKLASPRDVDTRLVMLIPVDAG